MCTRRKLPARFFKGFAGWKLAKRNLIKVLIVSGQCINTSSSDQTSPPHRHDFWHEYAYRWTGAKRERLLQRYGDFYFFPRSPFERAFLYSKFHDSLLRSDDKKFWSLANKYMMYDAFRVIFTLHFWDIPKDGRKHHVANGIIAIQKIWDGFK